MGLILRYLLIVSVLSGECFADANIIDDIVKDLNRTKAMERLEAQANLNMDNNKEKDYIKKLIETFNFSQDRDIIVIYDAYDPNATHGKSMLSIIDDGTNENIVLYDCNSSQILNKHLDTLTNQEVDFKLFISLLSQKFTDKKIIISRSLSFTNSFARSPNYAVRYNVIFLNLMYKLKNVYLNKSFGNLESHNLSHILGLLLDDKREQLLFREKIEYIADNILWNLEIDVYTKSWDIPIKNELLKFKSYHLKYFDRFRIYYFMYTIKKKHRLLDSYLFLACAKYIKKRHPESNIYERISIVKSITPKQFKLNVINAYNAHEELPEGIFNFAIHLHDSLDIENKDDLDSFMKYQEFAVKYKKQYPYLFSGTYDLNIGKDILEHTKTMFDGISIGTKEKSYGSSVSTAVKTYLDQLK